jgi:hypothetical protein
MEHRPAGAESRRAATIAQDTLRQRRRPVVQDSRIRLGHREQARSTIFRSATCRREGTA